MEASRPGPASRDDIEGRLEEQLGKHLYRSLLADTWDATGAWGRNMGSRFKSFTVKPPKVHLGGGWNSRGVLKGREGRGIRALSREHQEAFVRTTLLKTLVGVRRHILYP